MRKYFSQIQVAIIFKIQDYFYLTLNQLTLFLLIQGIVTCLMEVDYAITIILNLGMDYTIKHLQRNQYLIHLSLGNKKAEQKNRMGKQGCLALNDYLQTNKIIQILEFQFCGITSEQLNLIDWSRGKSLIKIDLFNNEIDNKMVFSIPQNLIELNLGQNNISLVKPLIQGIYALHPLRNLDLQSNKIKFFPFELLGKNRNLHTLILDGNPIELQHLIPLYDTSIKKLSFRDCQLSQNTMILLINSLKQHGIIQDLDFSYNTFGTETVNFIGQYFLETITNVQSFSMKGCSLSKVLTLFQGLSKQNLIERLDFSENLIEDDQMPAIYQCVRQNKILRYLNLHINMISPENMLKIDSLLERHKQNLQKHKVPILKLEMNRIQDLEKQQIDLNQYELKIEIKKNKIENQYLEIQSKFDNECDVQEKKTQKLEAKFIESMEELKEIEEKCAQLDEDPFAQQVNDLQRFTKEEENVIIQVQEKIHQCHIIMNQRKKKIDNLHLQRSRQQKKYDDAIKKYQEIQNQLRDIQINQNSKNMQPQQRRISKLKKKQTK